MTAWTDLDRRAMQAALAEARLAAEAGEVPIGAVIVDASGHVIAKGRNSREASQLVTGHAEIAAITEAEKRLSSWRLTDCTLYVTLEPCFMCAAAISQAQIARVVYGADDKKQGAVVSQGQFFTDHVLNHQVQAEGGLMAEESASLLQAFFRALRMRNKAQEKQLGGRGARRRQAKEEEDRGHPDTAAWLDGLRQEPSNTEGSLPLKHPDQPAPDGCP